MKDIGRRGLLQAVLALAGVAAVPQLAGASVFQGPASLPADTMKLVSAFADTVIPATDTPGAVGAGVPAMFEKLLANWASATQRVELLGVLRAIDTEAGQVSGTGFAALQSTRRFEILSAYDRTHAGEPAYAKLKELVIVLYYLSETGSTVELRYEHAPGAWEPSIPVTAETRNYGGPSF